MKRLLGDIYTRQAGNTLYFGNSLIELSYSLLTGNWLTCTDRLSNVCCVDSRKTSQPSLLLRVGGKIRQSGMVRNSRMADLDGAVIVGLSPTYQSNQIVIDNESVSLEIIARENNWTLTSIYLLFPEKARLTRRVRLEYKGEGEIILRDLRLLVPGVSLGAEEDTWLEAPDYPVPAHISMSEIPPGIWQGLESRPSTNPERVQHSVDVPGSLSGLIALHNPRNAISLLCFPHSTSEFSIMEVERTTSSLNFVQWLLISDRFRTGYHLETGTQFIEIHHGNWKSALTHYQAWFDEIGLKTPERPGWSVGTAIYEVHVGRAPFLNGRFYEPYPTMADLANDLPRIASMGFEVVQIMPHWPFCGYTVHDYYSIDQQYGEKDELLALIAHAHQIGLRVILDVVLHGCVDKEIIRWDMSMLDARYHFIFNEWLNASAELSPYRQYHPDWFMQDENGDIARIYTWAFDHANPSFQDFFINVLLFYIEKLHVDGFRFDAPTWNCIPNWKREQPTRPSASYYASYHLLKKARQEIKNRYPDVLFYTEPSGPLFREIMDLNYNYEEEWLSGSLLSVLSKRGYAGAVTPVRQSITACEAATWLDYQRYTLPKGSHTVHHLDSHDTFWWGEKAQFRVEAFGKEGAQALFALFALIGGGIMNYVGSEHESEAFYTKLLHLRQSQHALRYGECDFESVKCKPAHCLVLLRIYKGEHAIPLINFSPGSICAIIDLKFDRILDPETRTYVVFDLLNNEYIFHNGKKRFDVEALCHLQVEMPPYGVRVLRIFPSGPKLMGKADDNH